MKLFTQLPTRRWGRRRAVELFLMYAVCFNVLISGVIAGPEGAEVVNGQVSFLQNGNNTVINASNKAIINYSSFDITKPEIVEFIQPDSSSSVLNRILSANPTHIDGTLLANGRVFFVNPAGVYIGNGARINVNQLVASALNISNADFINGRYNFEGGDGSVINSGDISAEQVYLIGKQVANSGNISCPAGYVVMAAGKRVFLGEPGSDIVLEVEGHSLSESPDTLEPGPGVLNEGTVEAAGGIIALAAAGDIYSQAISNVGSLSVSSETGKAGRVKLADAEGTITNTGTIEASGTEGGQVEMEGARVGQFGTIQADGTTGNGGNVDLWAGDVVALSSNSLTTANAGAQGDGGEVIVYSPDTALFRPEAKIEAKGGTESGDGGFVEVSGKKYVEVFGSVDASADSGASGTFFIDPTDVTLSNVTANMDNPPNWNPVAPDQAAGTIDVATIVSSLQSGTDVSVDTYDDNSGTGTGRIIVDSAISVDLSTVGAGSVEAPTLTLNAQDDIDINAQIGVSATDAAGDLLNLALNATNGVDIGADITDLSGGTLTSAGTTFNNTGTITTTGGNVTLTQTGAVTVDAKIDSSVVSAGGQISITGSSIALGSVDNIITAGTGNVSLAAPSGSITVSSSIDGEITTTGLVHLEAQTIGASPNQILDLDGATALEIVDTGAGDIEIGEETASTIASTSITVNDSSGSISIAYFDAGGGNKNVVDIGDGHAINDVDLSHNVNSSFNYTAATGDVSIGTINTGTEDVAITAASGAIDNDANPNGTANIVGGGINLTASAGGIGNTDILEVDAATFLNADTTADNSNINIDGISDIPIGLVDAGSGNVILDSTGSINDATDDTTADISGTTITLTAADEIGGGIGTKTLDTRGALEVTSGSLDISVTTAGDVIMTESDGTQLADVDTSSGSVDIISTAGDLTIGDIDATGTVALQATTGSINDAADDTTEDISGTTITLTAADEIGGGIVTKTVDTRGAIEVASGSLDVSVTTAGNVIMTESDGTQLADVDTSSGSVDIISTTGDLTIGDIDATGAVALQATTGSINDATDDTTEDISGTTITLTAEDEIGGGIATKTLDTRGALEVASGSLDVSVTTAGDIIMTESNGTQLADVDTSSGSVDIISTTGDLTIGDIDATGAVALQATTGSINDAADDTTEDISGTTITLTAADEIGGGIATKTVDTRGALEVASGSLDVSVTTAGNVIMTESDDTQLADVDTSSGSVDIISTTGDLTIGDIDATGAVALQATAGSINETGSGDSAVDITGNALTLTAQNEIGGADELDIETSAVTLEALSAITGDIVLTETDNVTLGNIQAALGDVILQSTGGAMSHQVAKVITAGSGSLTMQQNASIDTKDFTFSNQSNTDLTLESFNGSVISDNSQAANAADKWQSIIATAENNIQLRGTGDIKIGGNLISNSGGVSIISDNGTVRTAGDSILDNITITGYSNQAGGAGVGLPFGSGQKAAIVISSKENLTLGTSATLNAGGFYDSTAPGNDDRASVGFASSGPEAGDPIDVAVYIGSSAAPKVEVRSLIANIGSNGTVVIDASDTVRIGDTFESSAFNVTHWLEVVSRESTTLDEAINGDGDFLPPRLPYATNPEDIRSWFDGTYVIRGKALFAEILALTNPVPLVPPQPLEPEIRGEVEGPDIEALFELLTELGIGVQPYVTGAYAGSLSTDLRLYKAAEKLQEFIPVLEDADGTGIAGLRASVAKFFPNLDTLTDEQVALFSRELENRKGDGSAYDSAGQCISALTEYVNILGTEIGWPVEKSVEFVMGRYVPRLTEGDDIRIAVVQMYLQRAF